MKRILVTGGGTAIAWHIAEIAGQYFSDRIRLYIADTNERDLVPSAVNAYRFFQVPPSGSGEYEAVMSRIAGEEEIDYIIPLIPAETIIWASDSNLVKNSEIESFAPVLETGRLLNDKRNMYGYLKSRRIETPSVYDKDEVQPDCFYMIKPRFGFGSSGISILKGSDILLSSERYDENSQYIIQEYCHNTDYEEVTCEIYNAANLFRVFARKRIAAKSGVCVKAEPIDSSPFLAPVREIVHSLHCPVAFNIQFLRDNGIWKLYDCNLRPGAGTAMATAMGFQLTRAMLGTVLGDKISDDFFHINPNVRKVLRVYREIIVS